MASNTSFPTPIRAKPSDRDPLRNFKFRVDFVSQGDPQVAQLLATVGFISVSGIGIQTEMIPYREGGDNAQPLHAKVLTKNGWKRMGDLEVGDRIIDPFGDESKVSGIFPKGERDVYRITLRDGSTTTACYDHYWRATCTGHYYDRVISTLEMADLIEKGHPVWLPEISPVEFEAIAELPLDPYLMGVLLAEGNLTGKQVSFAQDDSDESGKQMVERVRQALPEGVILRQGLGTWHITAGQLAVGQRQESGRNTVKAALRLLGLGDSRSHDKFIPEVYKFASVADRLALLQGIMDGDGYISESGRIMFGSASEQFRDDVAELINSLGGRCTRRIQINVWYTSPTQVEPKTARDSFKLGSVQMYLNPFFVEDKASRFVPKNAAYHRSIVAVDYIGVEEVQCIEVSAESHLYVTDDYMPTHNTITRKLPGQSDVGPLTLVSGVFAHDYNAQWQWFSQVFAVMWGKGIGDFDAEFRCDVIVRVLKHPVTRFSLGAAGDPASNASAGMATRFFNCWPGAIQYNDLNAGDNSIMITNMVLHHEGFLPYFGTNASSNTI